MGGARAILATGTSVLAIGPLVSGLSHAGELIVVGARRSIQYEWFGRSSLAVGRYAEASRTPIDSEERWPSAS